VQGVLLRSFELENSGRINKFSLLLLAVISFVQTSRKLPFCELCIKIQVKRLPVKKFRWRRPQFFLFLFPALPSPFMSPSCRRPCLSPSPTSQNSEINVSMSNRMISLSHKISYQPRYSMKAKQAGTGTWHGFIVVPKANVTILM
jgi:hypothetical protein